MHVTFRQLHLFLALADTGSVTAVAQKFHVSQPTVSMQLRELADSIGFPLYEIISKRLYLTAPGEALVKAARSMVEEWSAYEHQIAEMKGLTRGQLRIAVVSTAKYFIPRMLGAFCKQHPEIEIALEVLNRDGVVQRLRENRDDCYIMSMPPNNLELESRAFMKNPLVVIAPTAHRFASKKRVRLKELEDERFIFRERGSGTRLRCDAFFAERQFNPTVRLELGSNEAIKQAVEGGLGLSVISQHALRENFANKSLVVLNVEGFPIHSNWFTITLKGKRLSPPALAFLEYLNSHAEDAQKGVSARDSHPSNPPRPPSKHSTAKIFRNS
jgi:DNA-binding transcriptional LysR family regulator